MDFEYEGPTRYDSNDSEDELSPVAAPAEPSFVVRIKPAVSADNGTLVVSLLNGDKSGLEASNQIGVVYAPAAPSKQQQQPVGNGSMQVNNALARIFSVGSAVQAVVVSASMPIELQHGWIRAVVKRLRPSRIVVLDALDAGGQAANTSQMNAYRSPAVLASAIVVGLPAAVLNYAETFGLPCRHVRTEDRRQPVLLNEKEINALFANEQQPSAAYTLADPSTALRRDVSTSLYV
ncbi:hypothetical protein H4R20_002109 [Coemansia guatemalensis]|uniref:Uncharacterized protein n=1 Tax=Coemansia guatemalensis TaxID=2761395 RepID=A0A9W8HW33_9FUNG|nr:hypothetical protein H4R20_002109 [Coemansia guatemalensis]